MDGDLQAQDFGGLAEVVRVDDADDLVGEVANHRAVCDTVKVPLNGEICLTENTHIH